MSDIEIRTLSAQPTVCARQTAPKAALGGLFGTIPGAVFAAIGSAGAVPVGALYGRYFDFSDETVDVEIGVPVASPIAGLPSVGQAAAGEVGAGELPAGRVAAVTHRGRYEGLPATYRRLQDWIAANGHVIAGAPWEAYVDDPGDMSDMSNVRTEVYWPVA